MSDGITWWPTRTLLVTAPVTDGSLSTAWGAVNVVPSVVVTMTIRASPSRGLVRNFAKPRSDHARYTRPSPSTVIVG